jgi:hypothetical protein
MSRSGRKMTGLAGRAVMTSSSDPHEANSEQRMASGEDASGSSSSPLPIRHFPFATYYSPLTIRHSLFATRWSGRRVVKTQAALHLPIRHLPFATCHLPLATHHSPLAGVYRPSPAEHALPKSRLGPRLAPAPGCRPPERMPRPDAGASRQGEIAERAGMTTSSVLTTSVTPNLENRLELGPVHERPFIG